MNTEIEQLRTDYIQLIWSVMKEDFEGFLSRSEKLSPAQEKEIDEFTHMFDKPWANVIRRVELGQWDDAQHRLSELIETVEALKSGTESDGIGLKAFIQECCVELLEFFNRAKQVINQAKLAAERGRT